MTRLALGTAQLGLDYGIANTRGRPSDAEVDRLLSAAFGELGVAAVDTAPAYGDAEARLGAWFGANGRPEGVTIVTKLSAGLELSSVRRSLEGSCERLGCAPDIVLLHDAEDLFRHGDDLIDAVASVVPSVVGVSVYEPESIVRARTFERIGAIQFPFNVFDRRVRSVAASLEGCTTFARSVLLQGLFVAPPDRVAGAGAWVGRLTQLAARHGWTVIDVAIAYATHASSADYVLVGVESAEQLADLANATSLHLDEGLHDEIELIFADVDPHVIDPRRW